MQWQKLIKYPWSKNHCKLLEDEQLNYNLMFLNFKRSWQIDKGILTYCRTWHKKTSIEFRGWSRKRLNSLTSARPTTSSARSSNIWRPCWSPKTTYLPPGKSTFRKSNKSPPKRLQHPDWNKLVEESFQFFRHLFIDLILFYEVKNMCQILL